MELQHLEEEHRKQIAAAAFKEIVLMREPSSDESSTGKMSEFFTDSKKLFQDGVNSSSAGNIADVANEPSLHFLGSITQPHQAIAPRPSSAQPLNSYSILNTNGHVEANINLRVQDTDDPSSRNNVTNKATIANIMQD